MSSVATADQKLSRTLADCAMEQKSGLITAQRGKLKRIFCMAEGRLTLALSNLIEEQFHETLVRTEVLPPGDVAAAIQAASKQELKLTRLLLQEEILDADRLETVLGQHVRNLLFTTLDWPDGSCAFDPGHPDLGDEVTLSLPSARLLQEYTRHHPASVDQIRSRVGSPNSRPSIVPERKALLEECEADAAMTYLIERCNGSSTLPVILHGSPEPEEATWRAMYALVLMGVLEAGTEIENAEGVMSRAEVIARLEGAEGADYYMVLGLNASCPAEEIRRAYYVLARRYHPDRFRTGALQDLRGRVEAYFSRVTEAYNTLFDPRLRAEYDEQRSAKEGVSAEEAARSSAYLAKQNFLRAKNLIERGRFNDAVTSLQNAIALDAQQATYHLELGRLLARNPRMRRNAEEHLVTANRIDPAMADGYLSLGQLYLKTKRKNDAIRLFQEVLRWEPGHLEATAQLRALGQRPES